jgi:hypothetical protein
VGTVPLAASARAREQGEPIGYIRLWRIDVIGIEILLTGTSTANKNKLIPILQGMLASSHGLKRLFKPQIGPGAK